MLGWLIFGIGVLAVIQELWWQPRNMAKVREGVLRGGDADKFDAYLASRRYRWFHRWGLGAGLLMIVLGIMLISGVV